MSKPERLYHLGRAARTAFLYWDSQDSTNEGWAYRFRLAGRDEESGPVDGDLPADADLADVLDAAGSDLPDEIREPHRWTRFDHDGGGWELRRL